MGLVRDTLYRDKRPPVDWHSGRDVKIIKQLWKRGHPTQDIHDAIRGVALLRDKHELAWLPPGDGATLRVLYANNGTTPLWTAALAAYYKSENTRGGAPKRLREILGR